MIGVYIWSYFRKLFRIKVCVAALVSALSSLFLTQAPQDILIENRTQRFWAEVEAYPMHIARLPFNADVDFLGALSYGSNGTLTVGAF